MAKILNFPTNQKSRSPSKPKVLPLAEADAKLIDEKIRSIPIIKQALFFLNQAGAEKGIKLTEKGFLARNFIQSFWDAHLSTLDDLPFRPTREFECPEATRIHSLLAETKYVKKFKGAVLLTPKGRNSIDGNSCIGLYRDLFEAGMFRWNWGYEDRYPDFDFIQGSAPHLIERLINWSSSTVTAKQLWENVFGEFERSKKLPTSDDESAESVFNSDEDMIRCLNVRFFHRFAVPFGILYDVSDSGFHWKIDDPFERTEFFISDISKVLSGE